MTKKRRKKGSNNYFTQETEDAIVAYNNSKDSIFRDKLFREEIYYPFYKLAENIIHTWKFYNMDVENIENLKLEIVSLLVEEKIHRFDPSKGAKAYSYFGTIVKRHLIHYGKKNYDRQIKKESTEKLYEHSVSESTVKEDHQDALTLSDFFKVYVETMYEKLDELFTKDLDKKIADAILVIFLKRNTLEFLKKKALYQYIREQTLSDTPYLTRVVDVLKKEYYSLYDQYNRVGMIKTK